VEGEGEEGEEDPAPSAGAGSAGAAREPRGLAPTQASGSTGSEPSTQAPSGEESEGEDEEEGVEDDDGESLLSLMPDTQHQDGAPMTQLFPPVEPGRRNSLRVAELRSIEHAQRGSGAGGPRMRGGATGGRRGRRS